MIGPEKKMHILSFLVEVWPRELYTSYLEFDHVILILVIFPKVLVRFLFNKYSRKISTVFYYMKRNTSPG